MSARGGSSRAARSGRGDRAAREAGFTLIELLVYLGLMTAFLGTVAGADLLARRLYRRDAAVIAGFQARENVFRALAADFDRARALRLGDGAIAAFEGGGAYRLDEATGALTRDGDPVAGGVAALRVEPVAGTPALFEATLVTRGAAASGRAEPEGSYASRTYTRRFHLRNAEGGHARF